MTSLAPIWIQRSVRIKQLQEFLKSTHWLRRYCIVWWGILFWATLYTHFDFDSSQITKIQWV